jgi:hypothetical protein
VCRSRQQRRRRRPRQRARTRTETPLALPSSSLLTTPTPKQTKQNKKRSAFDTGGARKLSFAEFERLHAFLLNVQRSFAQFDADRSGSLSTAEVTSALGQAGAWMGGARGFSFAAVDCCILFAAATDDAARARRTRTHPPPNKRKQTTTANKRTPEK